MVDRLRSAAEELEAPHCPTCHIEMRWFRSELVQDAPVSVIAHQFICPNCHRAGRLETKFTPTRIQPDKLAAPRFFATAA